MSTCSWPGRLSLRHFLTGPCLRAAGAGLLALASVLTVVESSPASAQSGSGFRPALQGQPPAPAGPLLEQMAPIERQSFGVPPSGQLHGGAMHGPTPATIPGGQVITTQGLVALIHGRQLPFVLVDVLGQSETLPNAAPGAWLSQPGGFDDLIQQQAQQMLGQLTQGRKEVALIFYCQSRECWMSYNAALRAISAGYANVLWYRGGLEAWKAAGLPTQPPNSSNAAPTMAGIRPSTPAAPMSAASILTVPLPAAPGYGERGQFVAVAPLPPSPAPPTAKTASQTGELRIGRGRFFSFAMPPGWQIGEDAQYALTLVAPDQRAYTVMVGNAGMPLNYGAVQYAQAKLSAIRLQNLQLGAPRPARPVAGFSQAVEFDVSFLTGNGPTRGIAKVSEVAGYDTKTLAMTAALSAAEQWHGYSTWLPMMAEQVSAIDGAAFGRRGVMQQNLQMSAEFGATAARYREWSQKNWQGVATQRNESLDQRNKDFREALGGVQTYANPFGSAPPVELPTTSKYYWQDQHGGYVGTDDPRADPNVGSTGEWRRMERMSQ